MFGDVLRGRSKTRPVWPHVEKRSNVLHVSAKGCEFTNCHSGPGLLSSVAFLNLFFFFLFNRAAGDVSV